MNAVKTTRRRSRQFPAKGVDWLHHPAFNKGTRGYKIGLVLDRNLNLPLKLITIKSRITKGIKNLPVEFFYNSPHCVFNEGDYSHLVKKQGNTTPADPKLTRQIQELIQPKGGGHNEAEVADIIENALKILTDVEDKGDVRVIQTAVRELRYAFRVFAPYFRETQGHHLRLGPHQATTAWNTSRLSSSATRS